MNALMLVRWNNLFQLPDFNWFSIDVHIYQEIRLQKYLKITIRRLYQTLFPTFSSPSYRNRCLLPLPFNTKPKNSWVHYSACHEQQHCTHCQCWGGCMGPYWDLMGNCAPSTTSSVHSIDLGTARQYGATKEHRSISITHRALKWHLTSWSEI